MHEYPTRYTSQPEESFAKSGAFKDREAQGENADFLRTDCGKTRDSGLGILSYRVCRGLRLPLPV
ncbi:hypothetical protein ACFLVV_01040 [Chloroflexota bacterium]